MEDNLNLCNILLLISTLLDTLKICFLISRLFSIYGNKLEFFFVYLQCKICVALNI